MEPEPDLVVEVDLAVFDSLALLILHLLVMSHRSTRLYY